MAKLPYDENEGFKKGRDVWFEMRGHATAQAAMQVMNRFLNRLPTITIREGHRVKVYLTSDLELPAYVAPGAPN